MIYFFVGLIITFAAGTIWYVYQNSFASETLAVIFPAIGAILLSGYLGYKSIFLDNPAPTVLGVPIAILYDQHNGMIRGMAPPQVTLDEFRGARLIDFLPHYPEFQDLHLSESLRDTSGDLSSSRTTKVIEDILEYAIFEWLDSPDLRIGSRPGFAIQLINGGSSVGGPIPVNLVGIEIAFSEPETNPLLRARPIRLSLPKGSRVTRSSQSAVRNIEIETQHSHLQIGIRFASSERLRGPADRVARRIYAALGLSDHPMGFAMYGFELDFEASQLSYSRYSNQAKKEKQWIAMIGKSLERDFSWSRLRAFYGN